MVPPPDTTLAADDDASPATSPTAVPTGAAAPPALDSAPQQLVAGLLGRADIRLDGARPWDMQLHDPSALERALAVGNLGLGEAYMAGAWDCERLDMFFDHLLRAHLDREVQPARLAWHTLQVKLFNRQNRTRAWQVGKAHYDLGNDFYEAMLDPSMAYSCGYWRDADTLAAAQSAKLELICRKLGLQPGMRMLDIGCGWGSLMAHAARCLADGGLFVLHTIGKNRRESVPDRWIDKHIFPNGETPSIGQVGDAIDALFVCEDLHNFGADYDRTLMAWHENFEAAWPRFADALGETFRRKWRYYLLSCAGAFRARELQLWQWVLSKDGVRGGYRRPG